MTKKAILKKVKKIHAHYEAALEDANADLQESKDAGTMLTWLKWNASSFAAIACAFEEWSGIWNGCVNMCEDDSVTAEDMIERLRQHRQHLVDMLIGYTPAHSTSPMSNLLQELKEKQLKQTVGMGLLDKYSLAGVIRESGGEL